MANSYFPVTAFDLIPCSEEDYERLCEDDYCEQLAEIGITAEHYTGEADGHNGLYLFATFSIDYGMLEEAEDLRKHIGKIIEKSGRSYWEFGEAQYSDKSSPGTTGGAFIRWMKDGSLAWSQYVYPDFLGAAKDLVNEVYDFLGGDHLWDFQDFPKDDKAESTRRALESLEAALHKMSSFPWTAIKDGKHAATDSNTQP